MKWRVAEVISILLMGASLLIFDYKIYQYHNIKNTDDNNEAQVIEGKIQQIDKQIEEKEKEIQSLQVEKAWKVEVYTTWENEVKKLYQ